MIWGTLVSQQSVEAMLHCNEKGVALVSTTLKCVRTNSDISGKHLGEYISNCDYHNQTCCECLCYHNNKRKERNGENSCP